MKNERDGREGGGERASERDAVDQQFRDRGKKHPRYNFSGRQERINETGPND